MKPLEFEIANPDGSKPAAARAFEPPVGKSASSDPAALRTPQSPERIKDETVRWLAALPEHVRPVELCRKFPRIANKIALLWRRVARCEEFLDELVVDRRGGRKGFPMVIAQELTTLRRHYAALHPNGNSIWDLEGKGR
jgi:hypothetical protein